MVGPIGRVTRAVIGLLLIAVPVAFGGIGSWVLLTFATPFDPTASP